MPRSGYQSSPKRRMDPILLSVLVSAIGLRTHQSSNCPRGSLPACSITIRCWWEMASASTGHWRAVMRKPADVAAGSRQGRMGDGVLAVMWPAIPGSQLIPGNCLTN
jgi:hypothetical protein